MGVEQEEKNTNLFVIIFVKYLTMNPVSVQHYYMIIARFESRELNILISQALTTYPSFDLQKNALANNIKIYAKTAYWPWNR